MEDSEKLEKSLFKKAIGYSVDEVVEEYVNEENEMRLVKKKVTKKHIPPDVSAARALLEKCAENELTNLQNMSDADLEDLRKKVLEEIKGGAK